MRTATLRASTRAGPKGHAAAAVTPASMQHRAQPVERAGRHDIPFLRHEFLARSSTRAASAPAHRLEPRYFTLHDAAGLARRRAGLHQDPLLGRVRVRFRLGAGLRPRRRATTTRSSPCAVPFTPATGPRLLVRRMPIRRLRCASCCPDHRRPDAERQRCPRRTRCSSMSRHARPARQPAGCCGATASSTGATTATRLRALPGDLHRGEAQEGAARAAPRAEAGIRLRDPLRARPRRAAAAIASTRFHRDTFLRHGHEPYLTRAFFSEIARTLGESLMVKLALLRQ